VNAMIEDVQLQCKLVSNDKGKYER
jgi:hypothetical protein